VQNLTLYSYSATSISYKVLKFRDYLAQFTRSDGGRQRDERRQTRRPQHKALALRVSQPNNHKDVTWVCVRACVMYSDEPFSGGQWLDFVFSPTQHSSLRRPYVRARHAQLRHHRRQRDGRN